MLYFKVLCYNLFALVWTWEEGRLVQKASRLMTTNIYVFHFLTNTEIMKLLWHDVTKSVGFPLTTDVIIVVSFVRWKTAGCSPMSWLRLEMIHLSQAHPVVVPVRQVFVHRCIVLQLRGHFSMSRTFDKKRSKPKIFLAFLSNSLRFCFIS